MKCFKRRGLFFCVAIGLWAGLIIGFVTEYYTSNAYNPVQDVADSRRTCAATNVIFGLALVLQNQAGRIAEMAGCKHHGGASSRELSFCAGIRRAPQQHAHFFTRTAQAFTVGKIFGTPAKVQSVSQGKPSAVAKSMKQM
ncbi:hypothetical protein GUJ93_ZPchr0012g21884 [Zizania palustris]|uniref:H(+)-exporting diphosphatase n=1 Tax=Zizania palustris TaxID=103762 RepID=A0A8J5WH03_ZIZPA|nr:hypothetical protein GUJ93_ZPchr0012g21884 [Zizania palustris]